jgi:hypothetical protein
MIFPGGRASEAGRQGFTKLSGFLHPRFDGGGYHGEKIGQEDRFFSQPSCRTALKH